MRKRIGPIATLLAMLGFVVFVIVWVSRPSTAPQNMPAPRSTPAVSINTVPEQSTDIFGQTETIKSSDFYSYYTDEWTVDPASCAVTAPGIFSYREADFCTVEVDRTRISYLYVRGAASSFDRTSPRNSHTLAVVKLKGDLFSVFGFDAMKLSEGRMLPSNMLLGPDVFGFDITPSSIAETETGLIDHN